MDTVSETIRVLHVDDDPEFADLTADFLERSHDRMTVRTARSVDDGLELLATHDVDCIVSDYDIPPTNGIEFLETVRAEYPDLPFILYTGKGSEEIASEAISAGVTDYLQKGSGTDQYTILANRVANAVDRSRAHRVAAENEERLSMFVDQSPLGVVEWTDEFEFVSLNGTAEEILGYPESELVGESWEVIVPESEHERVEDVVTDVVAGTTSYRHVNENVTKDGERIVCEWHNHVLTDDGDVVAIFSQFQDVTEQKERERALRRERDRFKTLFETLPLPAVRATVRDGVPIVRQVNPAFEETFGYDAADIEGEDLDAYLTAESVVGSARAISRQVAETGRVTERVRRQTADGLREFRLEAVRVDASPTAEGYAIYVPLSDDAGPVDPDARETKIEALHDVAVALDDVDDPGTVYERVVAAAEDILAFDHALVDVVEDGRLVPEAVAGRPEGESAVETIDVEADAPDTLAARTVRTGEPHVADDLEERDVTPADPTFRSALTVPVGTDAVFQAAAVETGAFDRTDLELASLLVSYAEAALDRTEHKRELRERTEKLERQNDRLEKFARIISHDLKNPLTVAEGQLELARETGDTERLAAVERAHGRMRTLIDDLLTLAEERDDVSSPGPVGLAAMAEESWATVETADATLVTDVDRTVRADRSRLKQAFENLFRNAAEHGGTDVTVTVGRLEDGFYVEDDGTGLPEDSREAVFEAGYSTSEDGTGFGLSTVELILEAHGWGIHATAGEAGGARFEVTGVEFVDA